MDQNSLGEGVVLFLNSIPEAQRPACFPQLLQKAQGGLTSQQALVIHELLGGASAFSGNTPTQRALQFPQDHGPHLDIYNEWYFVVSTLDVDPAQGGGQIAVVSMMMMHRAVSLSVQAQLGWAPTDAVMLDANLRVTFVTPGFTGSVLRAFNVGSGLDGDTAAFPPLNLAVGPDAYSGPDVVFPLQVTLDDATTRLAVNLTHTQTQPFFLEGNQGWVPTPNGGGWLYYSWPQLSVAGTVTHQGTVYNVTGKSWVDHQWGGPPPPPTALAAQPAPRAVGRGLGDGWAGWVWFGFNFDDGTSMTFSGSHDYPVPPPTELAIYGTMILAGTNETVPLIGTIALTQYTTSPTTGAQFPTGWTFTVSRMGPDLKPTGEPFTIVAKPWSTDQFGMFGSLQEFWEGGAEVVAFDLDIRPGMILKGSGFCEGVGFETVESYQKRALAFLAG